MAHNVLLTKSAIKELDKLPERQRKRIVDHLIEIGANPRGRGAQKLKGRPEYKMRVGNFRIVYGIDDDHSEVTVYLIDDRKDIYKRLDR
jgi:mRNA interferase RelE/StbE